MKGILRASILALLAASSTAYGGPATITAATAPAASSPLEASPPAQMPAPVASPEIKRILQAMKEAETGGHPDLFGQFAGMQRLFKGDYAGAMKYFKIGARYADKLSQLSIGMLYLHGRGVDKDMASACAWVTLASERGYPSYLQARDTICATLDPAQRARSTAILTSLLPEYGDAAAQPRMKLQLTMAKNALTGSHLGHDSGVQTLGPQSEGVDCGGYRLNLGGVTIPRRGCGRYEQDLMDPKKYFAARDAQWFGTVTIGKLQPANPAPAKTGTEPANGGR